MQRKRPLCKVRPPAKPGACVSPERASYRQASQEALKKSAACITCPAARKRAPFVQDYLSGNRKVVHLFPLRSMLEAKAFLLSPTLLGGVALKRQQNKSRAPKLASGRGIFFHTFNIPARGGGKRQSRPRLWPPGQPASTAAATGAFGSTVRRHRAAQNSLPDNAAHLKARLHP